MIDLIARPRAIDLCRRALERSVLLNAGTHWTFVWPMPRRMQQRRFNLSTVNALIASGEAVREGNIVRAA